MSGFDTLLSPITIGSISLPNRLLMTPMGTEMGTEDGRSTPREAAYYAERAKGGTGLVMTGITFVVDDFDPIAPGLARIDTDEHTPGIAAIADAVHAHNGTLALQLTAGLGRNNQYCASLNKHPRSSSDNTWFFDPSVVCEPLTITEIGRIVEKFGEAAGRAHTAGVDLIDIHGHTGYLVDQFMSSCWNRRTDQYGGSPANRCRFVAEIVAAIRQNAPGTPISFRLSVDHKFEGGRTWEETKDLVVELEKAGIDLLICDDGSYEAMDYVFPPYYLGDGCMADAARLVKTVVNIPVAACGNITPALGEEILARGEADMIGIGRGLIADPFIIDKLHQGRPDRIRPCIRCNQFCTGNAFNGSAIGCAVNPEVGREEIRNLTLAATPKRVAIVGGGPAGLEAARVAGTQGHRVDVYEKSSQLGGVLFPAATPDFKRQLRSMINWWETELSLLPQVQIHLDTEITAGSPELSGADEIIVAVGSEPIIPPIPGAQNPQVLDIISAHTSSSLGKRIVVCGGGLSGADFALEKAHDGHQVTVVEATDEIAKDTLFLNKTSLMRALSEAKVTILTGHSVTSITDKAVIAEADGSPVEIACDSVVLAFGVKPAQTVVDALVTYGNKVHLAGDCVKPRKVGPTINQAYEVAYSLTSPANTERTTR